MSFSNPLKFTNAGKEIQLRALTGEQLIFTTVRMGDGELSSAISVMTALINERVSVTVNTVSVNSKYATIEAIFKNTDLTEGFYWREFGIYVANPDDPANRDSDILYAYQNAGELAEYINAPGSSVIEKIIRIPIFVGDAENVSVNVSGIVYQEATVTQEDGSDIENDDYLTFYDSSDLKNRKIPFSQINKKTDEAINKKMDAHIATICNENLVPNILPLIDDEIEKTTSDLNAEVCSVDLLKDGNSAAYSWKMKVTAQNSHTLFVGDIGTDEGFGGSCFRYIGYELPATANHCIAFYTAIKAPAKTKFKAGNYTLSFYVYATGSLNLCPLLKTVSPDNFTSVPAYGGDNKIDGVTTGSWQKVSRTFTIDNDTDTLYVVLDSTSKNTATYKKLLFADIKLEYGPVATRFNPDYSKEMIMNYIAKS